MFRGGKRFVGCLASLSIGAIGVAIAAPVAPASAAIPHASGVVINELYGSGGSSGAAYSNDFVELYNPTASDVPLTGWSLQYRSATNAGTNPFGSVVTLSGSIPAGGFYLIGLGNGGGTVVGAPLPTPNVSNGLNISGSAGVVLLSDSTTAATCATGATACAELPQTVDLAGYGATANTYAGERLPAPTPAVERVPKGASTWAAGPATPGVGTEPPEDVGMKTIAELQGTGASSPYEGDIATTTGVVTAAYPTGGFAGYYLQTAGTGGDKTLTYDTGTGLRTGSDAIFVYSPASVGNVAVGDHVQVKGIVKEFFGLTEIEVADAADQTDLAPGTAPTPITAPWPATDDVRERIEGMLYKPTGMYTVSDTFPTNQYGEVGLAFGATPLIQPTEVAQPTASAPATSTRWADAKADNLARGVVLDDGASTNFLLRDDAGVLVNGNLTPPYISLTDPVRVGATPTFNTDVIVEFRNGGWNFQPLAQVTDTTPPAQRTTFTNTRTAAPANVGGDLKLASFNVLNYFTTLGTESPSCEPFTDRTGDGVTVDTGCDQRGAWDSADFTRQQDKIVAAINELDADVVGLMEIENSFKLGETADEATASLVAALNAAAGSTVWDYVASSAELPPAGDMDVITNAIIYQVASVNLLGSSHALGDLSQGNEAFGNAREPIAQAFTPDAGGEPFLFVVNHFKSKGSGGPLPGDTDSGDGQGSSNASRVAQATALRDWVPTVLAGDPALAGVVEDVFLAGDFNSYTEEDPMHVLYAAGYTDIDQAGGHLEASYVFTGQSGSGEVGSLDHVVANESAMARITGVDIWNINSVESLALEYSRDNYHGTSFYADDVYRASDHDPVVVGIRNAAPTTVDLTFLNINDFHGRVQRDAAAPTPDAVDFATTVETLRAAGGEFHTALLSAGDNIGGTLFNSAVQQDQPTIDLLNALDLRATAAGNHEFDAGYDDLIDRVIDDGNNADFPVLGANVYEEGTSTPALQEFTTFELAGVTVGVIGVVTSETESLVSPDGIATLDFGDPVAAVNRVADQLTNGDPSDGEADVIIAEFHAGAPDGTVEGATLEQEIAADAGFASIVNDTSADVDAIFTGHTHKQYAWAGPVPGAPGTTRPIVQTGEYGGNVGKVVLTVETTTGDVTAHTEQIVPVTFGVNETTAAAQYPRVREVKHIVDEAVAYAAIVGNVPKGSITADVTTAYAGGSYTGGVYTGGTRDNRAGESALGTLIADAMVEVLSDPLRGGAEIGVMNPGGMRAELFYAQQPAVGEGDGVVTYGEAVAVLPFANSLFTITLTGAQFKVLLEQQWQNLPNGTVPSRPYLQLGLSSNVTYTADPARAEDDRITSITIDGVPYDPAAEYRVGTFSFVAAGGDNFHVFKNGTDRRDTGLIDRDAFVDDFLIPESPLSPDFARQSTVVSPTPTSVTIGSNLTTTVSSLNLTSRGAPENTTLTMSIGGVSLGSVPIAQGAAPVAGAIPVVGSSGVATVDVVVPAGVPTGAQQLVMVAQPSGTTVTLPITVNAVPDTTAPDAPVITSPTNGSTTNDTTPTVSGTAEAHATVEVFDGATSLGTTAADGSGAWSLTPAAPLADGVHTFTATATDAADNVSDPSAAVAVTIDSADHTAPEAPVVTTPAAGATVTSATPTIGGSAEPGASVTILDNGVVIGTATVDGSGAWSFTPSTPLADGLHSVTATAEDAAGNVGPASAPIEFTIDTSVQPPATPLAPGDPERILDTREGGSTYDDQFEAIGIQTAGSTLQLVVAGRGGVPVDAEGVVLNVTATDATGVGYVTVWPCGLDRPEASSLNFDPSAPAPNAVLSAIGEDGQVCIYTAEADVHLIADVNGYVPAGSGYEAINPARLADSRDGTVTIDGEFLGGGPRAAGSTWAIDIAGRGGVPEDAETASLNITLTGSTGTGYVTVWPCDAAQPTASSLNFQTGQTVPNAVITKLSADGQACVFVAESDAHVLVDVNGYFGPGSGYEALNPARLLETRNAPTIDGQFSNLGQRQPGEVLELTVGGRGGVPADAAGVVLNVTATGADATGYVTVWPCAGDAPNVSTVNFVAGVTRANASIAKLSPTGTVCLVVQEAASDLIVDVVGYLGAG